MDNFSKFLWCTPLQKENSQILKTESSIILIKSEPSSLKIESDRGSERYNSIFQKFLKAKNIHHFSQFTDKAPSIAERMIKFVRNSFKKASI